MIYMGHYVLGTSKVFSGLRGLPIQTFSEFLPSFNSLKHSIIFDDGLKCHVEAAALCVEHGVDVALAIPEQIIAAPKFLDVHKVHLCLAHLPASRLDDVLEDFCDYKNITQLVKNEGYYAHQSSPISEKVIKYLVNYSTFDTSDLIDTLFKELEHLFSPADFYMSEDDIKRVVEAGVRILPHGSSHKNLKKLALRDKNLLAKDIKKSINFAQKYNTVDSFVLPYGTPDSVDETVINTLSKNGIDIVFIALPSVKLFNSYQNICLQPRTDIGVLLR